MQKLLLSIAIIISVVISSEAQVQGGSIDKLAKLYNTGKYESCLFKADDYAYKDDYKRNSEPYLYIAMCYYQLSQSPDPDIQEDYKDGIKQAVKYTAKAVKYDKTWEFIPDNIDFVNEIKTIQYNLVKENFDKKEYRKAASYSKAYNRLNHEPDVAVLYFQGICEVLSGNYSQGTRDIDLAKEKLAESTTLRVDKIFKPIVPKAFFDYSQQLIDENNKQEAVKILEDGLKIFPDDGYIKSQYNMIKKSNSNGEE